MATRPGTHFIAFDNTLLPEEKIVVATFYLARCDLLNKIPKWRLSAELFLKGCGIEPEKVREAHGKIQTNSG